MYLKTLLLTLLLFFCCAASPLDLIPKLQVCPKGATSITEFYFDSTQWVEDEPLSITTIDTLDVTQFRAKRRLTMGVRSYTSQYQGELPISHKFSHQFADAYDTDDFYTYYDDNNRIDSIRHKRTTGSRFVMACRSYDTLFKKLYDANGVNYGDTLYTKENGYLAPKPDTLFVSYTYNNNTTVKQKEYYSVVRDEVVAQKKYSYDTQSITEEYYKADTTGALKLYRTFKLSLGRVFTLESITPKGEVFEVLEIRQDSLNRLAELTTFDPRRLRGRKAVYNYDEPTPISQGSPVISSNATVQVQANKLIYNSPSLQEGDSYVLYSIDGQVLKTGNITGTTLTVTLAGLSKGLYLCKVNTKHHSEVFKVEY